MAYSFGPPCEKICSWQQKIIVKFSLKHKKKATIFYHKLFQ